MGSGYAAHWADVMEWDDIKLIVPNEAAALEQQLQTAGVGMDDFCLAISMDDWDEVKFAVDTEDGINQAISQIKSGWKDVADAFKAATTVEGAGLELEPCHHDPDEGDRYDGIERGYFSVEGVYKMTPAGEKYADKIAQCGFVRFG
jgi:hypothetical protein